MNYEIISQRWRCPECSARIKLTFVQTGATTEEEPVEEFVCNRVLCEMGHDVQAELAQEMIETADQEFYATMERGVKVAEFWLAPDPAQEDPPA